jgi:hypothetical protein
MRGRCVLFDLRDPKNGKKYMNSKRYNNLIVDFWKWFEQNELTYRRIFDDRETDLIDNILNRLREIRKGLAVEFEKSNGIYAMTISADGVEENFDIVQQIIDKSLSIANWRFIAFRQPYDKDRINKIVITVSGYTLDPKQIKFFPIVEDGKLYIQIFSTDINEETKNKVGYGCLMLLDNIIGEYASVKKVDGYEYYNLKEAAEFENELKPLTQIGKYLDLHYQLEG